VVRTVAMLIAAISMSRPAIPKEEATRYAKILNEIGSKYDFDPLLAVAMIHHESHWIPSAASDDGEDYGLGQVRARFVGACRSDEDPVNAPSDACKAVKAQLLVGETNLRHMGSIIGANKKMCSEKRGKNKAEYWIAGYQGLSQPERNKYCIPGPTTTRVLDYHKDLLAALAPAPKAPKGTAIAGKGAPAKGTTAAKTAPAAKTPPAAKAAAVKPAPAAKPATKAASAKAHSPAKTAQSKASPDKTTKPAKPKQAQSKPAPERRR
jgi:hypothetical protein